MIIAIDFDDTIMDTKDIAPNHKMGKPEAGAVLAIDKLVKEGHTIIIFTARNVQHQSIKKAVQDWCDYFKLSIHGITNIKQSEFDVMIDNRGMKYSNWKQVMEDLNRLGHNLPTQTSSEDKSGFFTDITKPMSEQ